jgi:hypothetical protein
MISWTLIYFPIYTLLLILCLTQIVIGIEYCRPSRLNYFIEVEPTPKHNIDRRPMISSKPNVQGNKAQYWPQADVFIEAKRSRKQKYWPQADDFIEAKRSRKQWRIMTVGWWFHRSQTSINGANQIQYW